MKPYLEVVRGDLFDVASRLKGVDEGYFVCRNRLTSRYELHNDRQKGDTFCLELPFDVLDERTVRLARETRVERAEKIFSEMEEHNAEAERKAVARAVEKAEEVYFESK